MSTYADTSFLVSLYSPDANTAAAIARMDKAPLPLLLTEFGAVELHNAFRLRSFRKELAAPQIRAADQMFQTHIRDGLFSVRPLPEAVWQRARALSLRWTVRLGTRTLDILHVASALALKADRFYTFDNNQRRLAQAAGLASV